MIEGYSVDEAASVLGVPKGRVWELLARGVLAGTPEDGGGMRVYLQGRPMESIVGKPLPGQAEERGERPAGPNGNGGEHGQPGFEASPFRELLTEFRNLTERYGQALLALGEARGEVASLRTRVELLEARVDLRLPSPPLVQWSPPQPEPSLQESEPSQDALDETAGAIAPAVDEPAAPEAQVSLTKTRDHGSGAVIEEPAVALETAPVPARSPKPIKPRPRRRRQGARSATQGIAEALARAQDPTVSQLPGGDETDAAFAELRERIRRENMAVAAREPVETLEPFEAPEPAETLAPEPDGDIGLAETSAPAEAVELDPLLADEDLGGAIQLQPTAEEDAPTLEAPALVEEAGSVEEPPTVDAVAQVEEAAPRSVAEPVTPTEPPLAQQDEPAPVYSHEWDEPDWIAEEDVDWGNTETQAPETPSAPQEAFAMGESPEIGWAELPAATIQEPDAHLEAPDAEQEPDAGESPGEPVEVEPFESLATGTSTASKAIQVEATGSTFDQGAVRPEPRDAPTEEVRRQAPELAAGPEEELMWLGDEFRAGPVAWSSPGRVSTVTRQSASEATVSEAEDQALSRLAVERGWDDAELDAIRSLLAQPGRVDLPETELEPTVSARPETEAAEADRRVDNGPAEESRAEDEAHDEEARDGEARNEMQQDEEAFDWERGPSAWNPPPLAHESRELPGAVELDQAMAAFEVGAWSKEAVSHPADERPSIEPTEFDHANENRAAQPRDIAEPRSVPSAEAQPGPPKEPPAPPQPTKAARQDAAQPPATPHEQPPSVAPPEPPLDADDDWLRGRRGPAASAYRRLRRLFP